MTGFPSVETAVECMKSGASDYLAKPIDLDYLNIIVEKSLYKRKHLKNVLQKESILNRFREWTDLQDCITINFFTNY